MKTRFKIGDKAQIRNTKFARRLLWRVYLSWSNCGQRVTIKALNDDSFGSPPLKCHKVRGEVGMPFWVPPGVLKKL